MAVVITLDVFLRYFFGKPLLCADDISVYSMIFITFVGAALTLKMKRHITGRSILAIDHMVIGPVPLYL